MSSQTSFPREKIKILLLEGVHPAAGSTFENSGYSIELQPGALSEEELIAALPGVHLLGIRSKTNVTEKALKAASSLLSIGCFCIGTNQVDLGTATRRGVPVFNAPFSNTRSVAELTIAEIIMLARKAAWRSQQLHEGTWRKSAAGCYEVRNKTLGIVGYGHIGPQVGLLAEALGMKVVFYDIEKKLPLGNARSVQGLKKLLEQSDFVTLHVPETSETKGMIGETELSQMPEGSYLLNLSRGTVVDIEALKGALESGHIAGAAADVFPEEPKTNEDPFASPLRGLANVILTPHIGGSTLEAQENIGIESADALIKFTDNGSTAGAVNFPNINLPLLKDAHRVLNIHKNVPGVLGKINGIIAEMGANIQAQYLGTNEDIGYLIMDLNDDLSKEVKGQIDKLDETIRTRILF